MYQVMYHVEDRLTFQAQRQVQYLAICTFLCLAFCLAIRLAVDRVMVHAICLAVDRVNCLAVDQAMYHLLDQVYVPSDIPSG